MEIRKMNAGDLDTVSRLEQETFSLPWSAETLRNSMVQSCYEFLVAEEQGQVIGYCGMQVVIDEADITNIAVFSQFRGRGVGQALMRAALQTAKGRGAVVVSLEVRAGNACAIHVYQKLGFEEMGTRRGFYEHPREDALVMNCYHF